LRLRWLRKKFWFVVRFSRQAIVANRLSIPFSVVTNRIAIAAAVSRSELILQILYQGIVPNLIGLLLVTYAVRNIGAAAISAFMAAVPGLGALLSFLLLDEQMGALGWAALVLLTVGIVLMALRERTD